MKSILNYEMFRFVLVGFFNTFHYYVWYLLLNEVFIIPYIFAHWIAFLISMVGSFYLNTYFTYRTKPSWSKFFQFPLTNIVNIVVSTCALYVFQEWLLINNRVAPLLASVIAIPFTFLMSKKILKNKKRESS